MPCKQVTTPKRTFSEENPIFLYIVIPKLSIQIMYFCIFFYILSYTFMCNKILNPLFKISEEFYGFIYLFNVFYWVQS